MAKAMLIMDMPNHCGECQLLVGIFGKQMAICTGTTSTKQNDYPKGRPSYCPLREVPQKHERGHSLKVSIENDCYDDTTENDAWCDGVDAGYNACIDEILGGGE